MSFCGWILYFISFKKFLHTKIKAEKKSNFWADVDKMKINTHACTHDTIAYKIG